MDKKKFERLNDKLKAITNRGGKGPAVTRTVTGNTSYERINETTIRRRVVPEC